MNAATETAILAGGCFWPAQELLRQREGVVSATAGYTRSEIFYLTDEQRRIAEETIPVIDGSDLFPGKVVTKITEAGAFWAAEQGDQEYLRRYPEGSQLK